jgi:hypothetical protein
VEEDGGEGRDPMHNGTGGLIANSALSGLCRPGELCFACAHSYTTPAGLVSPLYCRGAYDVTLPKTEVCKIPGSISLQTIRYSGGFKKLEGSTLFIQLR